MISKQIPLVDTLRCHAEDLHSEHGHNKSARLLSQAADEIECLRSNALALEDEKNDYMDGVGDVLGQDHDGETLWAAAQRVVSECERLRAELTELRARLEDTDSACADYAFAGAHTAREIIEKLHDRIRGYRGELTEARKPDCHSCNWFNARDVSCVLEGGEAECVNGDSYEYAVPLRLYEKEGK